MRRQNRAAFEGPQKARGTERYASSHCQSLLAPGWPMRGSPEKSPRSSASREKTADRGRRPPQRGANSKIGFRPLRGFPLRRNKRTIFPGGAYVGKNSLAECGAAAHRAAVPKRNAQIPEGPSIGRAFGVRGRSKGGTPAPLRRITVPPPGTPHQRRGCPAEAPPPCASDPCGP